MEAEINQHQEIGTWEVVDLPPGWVNWLPMGLHPEDKT